jgi:hypothetical protein
MSFHEKQTHPLNLQVQDCDKIWHRNWSHNQLSLLSSFCEVVLKYRMLKITPHGNEKRKGMPVRSFFHNSFENAPRKTLEISV